MWKSVPGSLYNHPYTHIIRKSYMDLKWTIIKSTVYVQIKLTLSLKLFSDTYLPQNPLRHFIFNEQKKMQKDFLSSSEKFIWNTAPLR